MTSALRRRIPFLAVAAVVTFLVGLAAGIWSVRPRPKPTVPKPAVTSAGTPGQRQTQPIGTPNANVPQVPAAPAPVAEPDAATAMTVEKQVGQMFMVGFDGERGGDAISDINQYHIGGVMLTDHNMHSVGQARQLCATLQDTAQADGGLGLLISADQEGGSVDRLKRIYRGTFRRSQADFGEMYSKSPVKALAAVQSRAKDVVSRFQAIGLNMNLAPVMDVVTVPDNPVIGGRSFGSTPGVVSALGGAYIRDLTQGGIITTAKHFPGHGATTEDSHRTLPKVRLNPGNLSAQHIAPFVEAINAGVPVIMTASVLYTAWDKSNPATLSPTIIGYLRRDLKFGGVIITDDLQMDAISKHGDIGNSAVRAVNAGADILLFETDGPEFRRAYQAVLDEAKANPQFLSRVTESANRILQLKRNYNINAPRESGGTQGTVGGANR